jgi:hypothetical protein
MAATTTATYGAVTCKFYNWYCTYPPATEVTGRDTFVDTLKIFLITMIIIILILTPYLTGTYMGRTGVIGELMEVNIGQRNDKLMEMARGYRDYSGRDEVREYVRRTERRQSVELNGLNSRYPSPPRYTNPPRYPG